MPFNSTSIQAIIRAGASVVIHSGDFNPTTLQAMARVAHQSGTRLTIVVNSRLNSTSLQAISRAGNGHVTLDLTQYP